MPKWPLTLAIVALPVAAGTSLKSHDVNATFVSADPQASTFTVRLDDGQTSSGKAEGAAVTALSALKAGDKIRITCKDTADGQHVSATAISVLP